MTQLQWQASPSGTMTAQAFGFEYFCYFNVGGYQSNYRKKGDDYWISLGYFNQYLSMFQSECQSHSDGVAVAKAIDAANTKETK